MKFLHKQIAFTVVVTIAICGACASASRMGNAVSRATAIMYDINGAPIGTANLWQDPNGMVNVEIASLALPAGTHGIHFHEVGKCDGGATRSDRTPATRRTSWFRREASRMSRSLPTASRLLPERSLFLTQTAAPSSYMRMQTIRYPSLQATAARASRAELSELFPSSAHLLTLGATAHTFPL
jgi:hypothetical protein